MSYSALSNNKLQQKRATGSTSMSQFRGQKQNGRARRGAAGGAADGVRGGAATGVGVRGGVCKGIQNAPPLALGRYSRRGREEGDTNTVMYIIYHTSQYY